MSSTKRNVVGEGKQRLEDVSEMGKAEMQEEKLPSNETKSEGEEARLYGVARQEGYVEDAVN